MNCYLAVHNDEKLITLIALLDNNLRENDLERQINIYLQ